MGDFGLKLGFSGIVGLHQLQSISDWIYHYGCPLICVVAEVILQDADHHYEEISCMESIGVEMCFSFQIRKYSTAMAPSFIIPSVKMPYCVLDFIPASAEQRAFVMHEHFWNRNGFFWDHWALPLLLQLTIIDTPGLTCVVSRSRGGLSGV